MHTIGPRITQQPWWARKSLPKTENGKNSKPKNTKLKFIPNKKVEDESGAVNYEDQDRLEWKNS